MDFARLIHRKIWQQRKFVGDGDSHIGNIKNLLVIYIHLLHKSDYLQTTLQKFKKKLDSIYFVIPPIFSQSAMVF